ncbi:MAG: hypothetical protein ACKVHE_03175 [Planctomycetales bacterium]|jgi:hypothetical protein
MLTQLCLTITVLATGADASAPLICCGGDAVFILQPNYRYKSI